jgi:hypothetical protein
MIDGWEANSSCGKNNKVVWNWNGDGGGIYSEVVDA